MDEFGGKNFNDVADPETESSEYSIIIVPNNGRRMVERRGWDSVHGVSDEWFLHYDGTSNAIFDIPIQYAIPVIDDAP